MKPTDTSTLAGVQEYDAVLTGTCRRGHTRTMDGHRLGTLYGHESRLESVGARLTCADCGAKGLTLRAALADVRKPTKVPRR